MDGHGAIMPANLAPIIACALGGPAAGAWVHWLASSASHPAVRDVAFSAGNSMAVAARESAEVASGWLENRLHSSERGFCVEHWTLAFAVFVLALLPIPGVSKSLLPGAKQIKKTIYFR